MANKYFLLVLALVFSLCCASVVSAQDEWTGNINTFLGRKTLDTDDWKPAEEQGEFGVEFDFRPKSWPINIAIDLLGASGEGTVFDPVLGNVKLKSKTSEFNIGVRKIWELAASPVRPFIGGGLSFMHAEGEVEIPGVGAASESGNGTGIWLGGGVYFTLAEHFNLGFELKYSDASVTIAGVDVNAGGTHIGLLAGYHW